MATKCTLLMLLFLPLVTLLLINTLPAVTALPASRARRSLLGRLLKPLRHRVGILKAELGFGTSRSDETAAAWREMYRRQLISKIEPSGDELLVPMDHGVTAQSSPESAARIPRMTESTSTESDARESGGAGASQKFSAAKKSDLKSATLKVADSGDSKSAPQKRFATSTRSSFPRRSVLSGYSASAPTSAPPPTSSSGGRRGLFSRELRGGGSPRRSTLDAQNTSSKKMASAPASEPSVPGRRSMLQFPGNQGDAPRGHAPASAPCPGGPPNQSQSGGGGSAPFPLTCPNPEPTAMCDFVFDGSMEEIPTVTLPALVTDAPLDITPSDIVTVVGGTYLEAATANTSALVCSAEAAKTNLADVPLQFPDGVFEMRDLNALVYNGQLMKGFLDGGNDWANAFRADAEGKDGALVRVQIESALLNAYGTETKVGKGANNGPSGSNLGSGSGMSGNGEGDSTGVQYFPYERLCVMFRVKVA